MGQKGSRQQAEDDPAAVEAARQEVAGMSIKEMKQLIEANGLDHSTCVEKADLSALAVKVKLSSSKRKPRRKERPQGPPKNEFCSCWQFLLPEAAPVWYSSKIGAGTGDDLHGKPAPDGSLFLLGHVEVAVPDQEMANTFFNTGCGFGVSTRSTDQAMLMNAGASQIHLKIKEGGRPQKWPGDIRFWVDNIQTTYDLMTAIEGGTKLKFVQEYGSGINGGEFSMKMLDPWEANFYVLTEAPKEWPDRLRQIGCEAASMKSNVVALSDVGVKTRTAEDSAAMGNFYKHFFKAPITVTENSCMVHFSPAPELHQTLSFVKDDSCPAYSDLGSICFYLKSRDAFQESFTKCMAAGIVEAPSTLGEASASQEFVVRAVVDPESKRELLPVRNVVRLAEHKDCLVI